MAESVSHGSGFRSDIQQILLEAQYRWLRPAEICEILQNYRKFHIASEPPYKPLSGSLFLFDRKVLRYFRKDGHNWRKKKDGKTVREAHEKLKVGSVDVLHCYYAHGEENENFQRRSYWMLEQDFMHIVFVHYLEVKGNKTNISCIRDFEFQNDSPLSFSFPTNHNKAASGNTDSTSPTSTLTSVYEDAESEDNHQASSRFQSFLEVPLMEDNHVMDKMGAGLSSSYFPLPCSGSQSIPGVDYISLSQGGRGRSCDDGCFMSGSQETLDLASREEVLGQCTTDIKTVPSEPLISSNDIAATEIILEQKSGSLDQLLACEIAIKQESSSPLSVQVNWQKWNMDQNLSLDPAYDLESRFLEQKSHHKNLQNAPDPFSAYPDEQDGQPVQSNLQILHSNAKSGYMMKSNSENGMPIVGAGNCSFIVKQPLVNGPRMEEGLKKVDSFSRWIAKEFGEGDELHIQSTYGVSWSVIESGDVIDDSIPTQLQLDTDSLNPSLSQDQLFSIIDFSPNWAHSNLETKVLVTGTFMKTEQEVAKCKWSCMFGEVEVPAEVLTDGVLRCHAPPHRVGRVPFYVTCSNRLACSEVREFEYRVGSTQDIDAIDIYGGSASKMLLHMRLERLLSLGSINQPNCFSESDKEKQNVVSKLISLMEEEENYEMENLTSEKDFSQPKLREQLFQKQLKEKLWSWLLYKVTEDGKGPNVLDEEGQGVLHLAAALGYNWALKPTIVSGVNIDFRDVNGWTALHWAAFCGREETVAALVSLGAAPGALEDPSPEFPLGRTPADLASGNGHKGISGFLAESSLTTHLSSLAMNDPKEDSASEISGVKAVQTVSERTATPITTSDVPDVLSLRDSLAAVSNATQAACRIHEIFRMQSFERKQLVKHGSSKFGLPDERAISLVAVKMRRPGQNDRSAHAAAIRIQNKFRGWKKRKEFLIIRQRIVKIQAHVRGHQVRKKNRTIIWSVGILEKVILRWRRKGSGLRGYRPDAVIKGPNVQGLPSPEDDYDFLKEGRKQTEKRLQKALSRVKSMVQYPEARAQYRRLLTVAEGFRETKDVHSMILNSSETAADVVEDLIDVETLLDDDTFMSIAFE
uniref:Putative calmodulin-binding transcription activator 3-like isoform X1 n=1 Tax=Davidia involucrata TaxID=16924 RepID=A0A5B6Z3X7_DAVIN